MAQKTKKKRKKSQKQTKRKNEPRAMRYHPSVRLAAVRNLLNSSDGASVYDIADRLDVSVRTAHRYLRAIEESGDAIYDEVEGQRKVWRLMPSARSDTIRLTTSQMMSLYLGRRVFTFLEGTGFKEDLEDVFIQLEATLRKKSFLDARYLDRKLFDVNEAPYVYKGRFDHVNDIVTALVREEKLVVRHDSIGKGKTAFTINPYTLVVYKKGLYLYGYSDFHDSERTFGLYGFRQIDWKKNESFTYPKRYKPDKELRGAFGLIKGPKTSVEIFFDERVRRFIERRKWHPTQRVKKTEGGIIFKADVEGVKELESWVLGFGDRAKVLSPPSLVESIKKQLQAASRKYGR